MIYKMINYLSYDNICEAKKVENIYISCPILNVTQGQCIHVTKSRKACKKIKKIVKRFFFFFFFAKSPVPIFILFFTKLLFFLPFFGSFFLRVDFIFFLNN